MEIETELVLELLSWNEGGPRLKEEDQATVVTTSISQFDFFYQSNR